MTTTPEPNLTEADVRAIAALLAGEASGEQQTRGMAYIVTELCRVNGITGPGASDAELRHNEGRRYVGLKIIEMRLESTLERAKRLDASVAKRIKDAGGSNPNRSEPPEMRVKRDWTTVDKTKQGGEK